MEKKISKNGKRLIFAIAGIAVMLLFNFVIPVPESFQVAAASAEVDGRIAFGALGIILFAIIWWIGSVYPTWITSLLMMCFFVYFHIFEVSEAFSGFTKSTVWIIFGGLIFSLAAAKCGVLKRLAYFLMQVFPATYRGQVAAILVVGTILQPLIPTTAPKTMLMVTLAMSTADALGFDKLSKGRVGLFAAAFLSGSLTAPAFLQSSSTIMAANNMLPEQLSMMAWTMRALPWLIIVLVGGFLAITMVLYKDASKENVSKAYARQQYQALGKLTKDELITGVAIVLALIFWIQGSLNAGLVSICAGLFIFLCGTLKSKDLNAVNWQLLVYVASLTTISSGVTKTGLNVWISNIMSPLFNSFPNRVIIIFVLVVLVVIVRFLLVSQATNATMFTMILSPIFVSMGMDPFIAGFTTLSAQQVFFFQHQNTAYAPLVDMTEGGVMHKQVIPFAVAYQVIALIAIGVSCIIWGTQGLL